jgi:glutamyl-tRNA synthetase
MAFLFVDERDFVIAPDSWERLAGTDRVAEVLDAVIEHLETCDWTVVSLDPRPAIQALGIKPRKVMPALYAAVEGRHAGLPLFESMCLLGRERTLGRLRAARKRLADT